MQMCVCVCVWVLPASHTHTQKETLDTQYRGAVTHTLAAALSLGSERNEKLQKEEETRNMSELIWND